MNSIKQLQVFYHQQKVGTLALYKDYLTAFEYDKEWIANGFPISPFSLPLKQTLFIPNIDPFDGIFGVFADSLPDGWGRLLVDRLMLQHHINPSVLNSLTRLAIVGSSGMGALTYEPDYSTEQTSSDMDLDQIAEECHTILQTDYSDNLDELFRLGGSSGGARPKILTRINGEEWIIKFPSSSDNKDIGNQEYDYSLCAKECGIFMTETRLFPSRRCNGYFGTKRFDREETLNGDMNRLHMLSASAILETSHRIPNLDYDILMKLTLELTKESEEVEKLFRLMCFNVFAHNRDDHSKNFTYLYLENEDRWILSPAYDLTYSHSLGGEHATSVHGNGRNPGMNDILAVAKVAGISLSKAKQIASDVQDCVQERLYHYL
jgi:serine/threonine-protein kinase HipA